MPTRRPRRRQEGRKAGRKDRRQEGRKTKAGKQEERRQFQLYVFDLDGTLIDSRRDLANALNALLVECGAAPLAEDRVGRMVGDGAAALVARAVEARGGGGPARRRACRARARRAALRVRPTRCRGSSRSTSGTCSITRGRIRACATCS